MLVTGLVMAGVAASVWGLVGWSGSASGAVVPLGLAGLCWTSAFWVWVLTPGSTSKDAIDVGFLGRTIRWARALWLRSVSTIAGWPHVILTLMGERAVRVQRTPGQVVWRRGKATLTRYTGPRDGEPVLLVHALVSRPWILDLTPEASLVRTLVGAGYDVFLLDWGDPGREERHHGLDAYAVTLLAAEEQVLNFTGADRLHLMGYCLGATLCLARLASHSHDAVASFAAIGAPVDLAVPGGMQRFMAHRMLKPAMLLDGSGCVPAAVVRGSFHLLRPEALKAIRRAREAKRDPVAWGYYVSLARWVWDHRRLPGALFFDLVDLYRSNALFRGTAIVCGKEARLRTIQAPVLMAVAERDHVVPGSSTHALATVMDVAMLPCPSGHVSLLVGRGARSVLFPGLLDWLRRHPSRRAPDPRPRRKVGSTRQKKPRAAVRAR